MDYSFLLLCKHKRVNNSSFVNLRSFKKKKKSLMTYKIEIKDSVLLDLLQLIK